MASSPSSILRATMATTPAPVSARLASRGVSRRSARCAAERDAGRERASRASPSPETLGGRRHAILSSGATVSGLLFPREALAYGLGKAPPASGNSNRRTEEEIRRVRDEAERRRDERAAEANPGVLVTLPSGIQYRELDEGKSDGKTAQKGDTLFVLYTVYRLAPGAYFKYSSGGTPIFMWARGYGTEGQDDVGATYKFVLGDPDALPRAVSPAVLGMREGGRRRVLVPPALGWVNGDVNPKPPTFGAGRRLANHREEPLLMEVDLVRVRKSDEPLSEADLRDELAPGIWGGFKLPAPPRLSQ